MDRLWSLPFVLCLLAYAQAHALANPVTINFEGFPDNTILTNQYPGLTFSNAIVLTAGISLNEIEFPPHSGSNVASDNSGPMAIAFNTPITSFRGYFTYAEPLKLDAFDASKNEVAMTSSAFSSNLALSGDPGSSPNEFLFLSFSGGISSIMLTGDLAGKSFVLDDATITSAVPEPSSIPLMLGCAMSLVALRRKLS